MNLTENKIYKLYAHYKKKARQYCEKANYNNSLLYLTVAGYTGYHYYIGYKDDEVEDILSNISNQLIKKKDDKHRKKSECVFYDSFSSDNGGLTQQYLTAIISCGLRLVYITERKDFLNSNSEIKKQLDNYGKAVVIEVPSHANYWEKAQFVYDTIIESEAEKLFIHTEPYSAFASVAFYGLPNTIKKYKINLTDQTFWLGTGFIDYSFEFRQFGWHLSVVKRGISDSKILCLPYYPILNNEPFQGFPAVAQGKIILFSGASYYKIYDKDDIFFKICKEILNACPELLILFAGYGRINVLNDKLVQYGIKDRFIPIGQRSDITEVFKHCDIYLNTYPVGGGLMLLYAAQLGKPIVCYRAKTTAGAEDIVCQRQYYNISDDDIPSLVKRVKRLVNDSEYRKEYGCRIKDCTISNEMFNSLFSEYLDTGINKISFDGEINYERHTLDINNAISYDNINKMYPHTIVKFFGKRSLFECPDFLLDYIITNVRNGRWVKKIARR